VVAFEVCHGQCYHITKLCDGQMVRYEQVTTLIYIYTSRLPVRCDSLQQYPRKLSIKKNSRFFIDCLRSLYNIFFDLAN
jgi:hypothetical protein